MLPHYTLTFDPPFDALPALAGSSNGNHLASGAWFVDATVLSASSAQLRLNCTTSASPPYGLELSCIAVSKQ